MTLVTREQYKALEQQYHQRRREHRLVPRTYD
jgi:hypothetical protein